MKIITRLGQGVWETVKSVAPNAMTDAVVVEVDGYTEVSIPAI